MMTVLQACEIAEVEIPRFCYHEKLSIAGNCRMCLVELEKSPNLLPHAQCLLLRMKKLKQTHHLLKKLEGRYGVFTCQSSLRLSCLRPGGECDLQDQSMYYGVDKSRFVENKRQVKKNIWVH